MESIFFCFQSMAILIFFSKFWLFNFFSEIPNFLSSDESNELLRIARNSQLETSDIYHPSLSINGTMGPERFFYEWDTNHDGYISEEEVLWLLPDRVTSDTSHNFLSTLKRKMWGCFLNEFG